MASIRYFHFCVQIRMKRRKSSSSQYRPFDPNEGADAIGLATIADPNKEQDLQQQQQNYGAIQSGGGVEHVKGNPFAKVYTTDRL